MRRLNETTSIQSAAMSIRHHIMLVEAFHSGILLLEDRMDFLTKTFLPKLEAMIYGNGGLISLPNEISQHLPSFKSFQQYIFPPNSPMRIRMPGAPVEDEPGIEENPHAKNPNAELDERRRQVATEFLNYIVSLDPDPLKKNVQWLLTAITRNKEPMPLEDLIYAEESLTKFMEMKKERLLSKERSNIMTYKSLSDLNHALRGEQDSIQAGATSEDRLMRSQSNILYDGPDYSIISPLTKAAAGYFGRNTEWCTAWGCPGGRHPTRSDNYFDTYNRKGPLYIITDKSTGELWQFSFASGQYMDVDDRSINLDAFFKKHPKVEEVFENMDGEPISMLTDDKQQPKEGFRFPHAPIPVYALGKGFVIKSKKGPRGDILLQANVSDDGKLVDMTGKWSGPDSNMATAQLAELLTNLHITGDTDGTAQLGLYYRDGKWGTLSEVAKPFLRVGDLEWRKLVNSEGRELVLGVTNDFGKGIMIGSLFDGSMYLSRIAHRPPYETEVSRNNKELEPSVSRAVTDMLLKEPETDKWDKESKIKSYSLTDDDAKRLIITKPGFSDIATDYKIHGPSESVKNMIVDWCNESDISIGYGLKKGQNAWVGDNLIIQRFDNVQDLVEEYGNDTAKWVNKLLNGEQELEYHDATAESYQIRDMIRELRPDVLTKLGKYLQEQYPDEAEDIEDYDPSDADSVYELFSITDDADVQSAANYAVEDGQRVGAENEAAQTYRKALENNGYVVFFDESGAETKMTYDEPCCLVIPLKELVEYIKSEGEEQAGYNLSDGWTGVFDEAKINIEQPYYGFSGYDDDAAKERFVDSIYDLLP